MPYLVKTFSMNETLEDFLNEAKIQPNNIQFIKCNDNGIWDICVWIEENNYSGIKSSKENKSCNGCLYSEYSMPQCKECPDNNYKYYSPKIDY